jgi:GNAT superfamily N-acetyltransferase
VARYIRSSQDGEVAEVAVTVADDWQGRGLGRALLDRLTDHARQAGVRRFSALVQSDNSASLGLLEGVGDTQRESDSGVTELVIELPAQGGIGARLARALRAAAAGTLIPARTLAHQVTTGGRSSTHPPSRTGLPIQAIVGGAARKIPGVAATEGAIKGALAMEEDVPIKDYEARRGRD